MKIERLLMRLEERELPTAIKAYIALHAQTGCRISDLLKIDYKCVTSYLNISILQGKGSQPLVVQPLYYRDFWRSVRELELQPMASYNRFYFYRLYRSLGIVFDRGKGKNSFVTHSFRKALADDVYNIDGNLDRVSGALGHRSSKSAEHYVIVGKNNDTK